MTQWNNDCPLRALCLDIALKESHSFAANRLALWRMTFDLNSHTRGKNRTQWCSADCIDALIVRSAGVLELQPVST